MHFHSCIWKTFMFIKLMVQLIYLQSEELQKNWQSGTDIILYFLNIGSCNFLSRLMSIRFYYVNSNLCFIHSLMNQAIVSSFFADVIYQAYLLHYFPIIFILGKNSHQLHLLDTTWCSITFSWHQGTTLVASLKADKTLYIKFPLINTT